MEIQDIVTIYESEPRAGTWLIAKGFNREHRIVVKLVEKYRDDFEDFSTLKVEKYCSTGGRPVVEFLLTEEQVAFLGTLFRNNPQTVNFKKLLVKEFYRMKRAIANAKAQHTDVEWIENRREGKIARLEATDVMKGFKTYATEQGSTRSGWYYVNITKMMNSLLFIVGGRFKNLRELMTPRQLAITTAAEYVIEKALKDGMRDKMYYKEIYKLVKERVQRYAELHGQSEIISKQLQLFQDQ